MFQARHWHAKAEIPLLDDDEDTRRVRSVEEAIRLQAWGIRDDHPHRAELLALFAFGVASSFARAASRISSARPFLARQAAAALSSASASLRADSALLRALAIGDAAEVSAAIRTAMRTLEDALVAAYAPADGTATVYRALTIPDGLANLRAALGNTRIATLLDAAEARSLAWARTRALEAARLVASESGKSMSALLERAGKEGWTAAQTEHRLAMHAGLTRQQSSALERQRRAFAKEGIRPSWVDRRLSAQANRYRRQRAAKIAEHEAHLAAQMGQVSLWQEAEEAGLIAKGVLVQVWVTAIGERTCPYCGGLDGKAVSIGGTYDVESGGKTMRGPAPPIHPRCRCALVLMVRSDWAEMDRQRMAA